MVDPVPFGDRAPESKEGARTELPLPHNIDAEQALLGAIFVNTPAYHRVVGFLQPEHLAGLQPLDEFYAEVHRLPFTVPQRWIPRELPITRIGPDIYVQIAPARAWLARGMQPEPQRPRRPRARP
jgi:DnaB helicase-like protein